MSKAVGNIKSPLSIFFLIKKQQLELTRIKNKSNLITLSQKAD
jgi:hypothetical protein